MLLKTQRMSDLDEHQKTLVFTIHEKKTFVTFYKRLTHTNTHTHTHICKDTHNGENKTLPMHHNITDNKYKTQAIFKSIVSFLRHIAKLVRESKLVPSLFSCPEMYCMQCVGTKRWKHPDKVVTWKWASEMIWNLLRYFSGMTLDQHLMFVRLCYILLMMIPEILAICFDIILGNYQKDCFMYVLTKLNYSIYWF